jgi:endonuclease YncB( thermonuclease family)
MWALFASQTVLLAQSWERLDHCEFYQGSHSDGDSIEVRRDGKHYVFRLYFVDCLEKNPASRVRRAAQARYFGISEAPESPALRAAYLARNFTKHRLSHPFTVYTRWQAVDPDGDNPAIRAFVETADGKDLSTLLVCEGLAIIRHGKKAVSDHPSGRSSGEISLELRRAEKEAKDKKRGAWGLVNSRARSPAPETLEATEHEALVANAGRKINVLGRVARVVALPDGRMTFINFESPRRGGACVGIVRASFLPSFLERFPQGLKSALVGRRVILQGAITLYRGTPQIELESPGQLRIEPD